MLAVMFSGRYDLVRDEDRYIFIDRDGSHFGLEDFFSFLNIKIFLF